MVDYVEMVCDLTQYEIGAVALPTGIACVPVGDVDVEALFGCYHAAFAAGDAQFFFEQTVSQRREFFDTLGLEQAVREPASIALVQDGQVVGFSLVLPYGNLTNRHISCMCIHPDFQGRGLGKQLLLLIMQRVKVAGGRTITLGTEPGMRAFTLYKSNGFVVTDS